MHSRPPRGAPVLVVLDLDPARRSRAQLAWQYPATPRSETPVTLLTFGSARYESTVPSPVSTRTVDWPVTVSAGTALQQVLQLTPGGALVVGG